MREPAIREATAGDLPAILGLIAASYEREDDPGRRAYWGWKHAENPFGTSPCLVAESDGQIVGVRAFLRWTWSSGGRRVRAVRAVDTATHPQWRGQGVFSKLTTRLCDQMRREGVSFIYNTPNGKSMPGYLKMGWTVVTRIPLWVRPVSVSGLLRGSLGLGSAPPPTLARFGSAGDVLADERLPGFLSSAAPRDDRYHTERTLPYLRWRYGQIPGLSYSARFDAANGDGALVIARGRLRGRLREITISELIVTPTPQGVQLGRSLLSELVGSAGADYVAACAPRGTAERKALARARFLPVPRLGPHLTARRLHSDGLDPSRWANWRCSIGDLELF